MVRGGEGCLALQSYPIDKIILLEKALEPLLVLSWWHYLKSLQPADVHHVIGLVGDYRHHVEGLLHRRRLLHETRSLTVLQNCLDMRFESEVWTLGEPFTSSSMWYLVSLWIGLIRRSVKRNLNPYFNLISWKRVETLVLLTRVLSCYCRLRQNPFALDKSQKYFRRTKKRNWPQSMCLCERWRWTLTWAYSDSKQHTSGTSSRTSWIGFRDPPDFQCISRDSWRSN